MTTDAAKTRWGCPCGAVWESADANPPLDRACYAMCPKPPLFKLKEESDR